MTLPNDTIRMPPYTGNGVTTTFPYTFKVWDADELIVYEDGEVITTGFTITGVGSDDGGNVVFTTAPASGVEIVLVATITRTQDTDLVNHTAFFQSRIEDGLDRVTRMVQVSGDDSERSLRLPANEAGSDLLTILPPLSERKGRTQGYDATTGQPVMFSTASTAVSVAMEPVIQAATLDLAAAAFSFAASGGTVARSLRDRFADCVNVLDFGAVGDGVTDCAPAINAALAFARTMNRPGGINQTGGRIYIPTGRYLIKSTINVVEGDTLLGDPSGLASVPTAQAGSGTQVIVSTTLAGGGTWSNSIAITCLGGGPITIQDIAFNGTQTVTNSTWLKSGDGVTNIGLTQSHFSRLRVVGFSTGLAIVKFFDANFDDVGFEYCTTSVSINGAGSYDACAAIRFNNCVFFEAGAQHFALFGGAVADGLLFTGCDFDLTSGTSLWHIVCYDASIKNWSFSACRFVTGANNAFIRPIDAASSVNGLVCTGCFFVGGTSVSVPYIAPAYSITGVTFAACKFDDCLFTADTETQATAFVGCRFKGASTVTITAAKNSTLIGNDFGDCTGSVLVPSGVHDGLVISANLFPASYTSFGINVTSTKVRCIGNVGVADYQTDQVLTTSATYDPPNLADGAGTTTTVTCTGAALGDLARASFSLDLQGITVTAWVSSANTVSVRFQNESGGVLDLASGTLRVRVEKP